MLRVGIDIGGTFTDFVAIDDGAGRMATAKVLTTPASPTVAVMQGLEEILRRTDSRMSDVGVIVHGTTLATNAIIERRGPPTALLTTKGFRDVLEIGRERRYDIYDILFAVPKPLVPRDRCWEATERIGKDGDVVVALDTEALVEALGRRLADDPVEAIGICFLHAHRNGAHERAAADAISKKWPHLFVSVSSDVSPEPGEYERASTVSINAYIQPVVKEYVEKLTAELERRGARGRLFVMLSNGGLTTPEMAQKRPIGIIESGPAGGVQTACTVAQMLDRANVVAFDMGGTTAKICLIVDGLPSTCNEFEVGRLDWSKPGSGLPVKAPFIEMIEIGTGGGSVATISSLGLVAVGPQSAGANPGPACYGIGGTLPTVTDADLVLGLLRADGFAGGAFLLSEEKAREAIGRHIAEPLGVGIEEAAWAVHQVASENMANAARLHAAQRGADIASFTLVAFGGAGPVHAAALAQRLGINEVVFPFAAGVASALGFLLAPVSFEVSRTLPQDLREADFQRINAMLEEMEDEARDAVCRAGVDRTDVTFDCKCSMSYRGQGFPIDVACPTDRLNAENLELLRVGFEQRYRELYSALISDLEIRISTWRVIGRGPKPHVSRFGGIAGADSLEEAIRPSRPAFDPLTGMRSEHRVYTRALLPRDARIAGPAIIEEPESTIVLGAGMDGYLDGRGNLIGRRS